MPEPRKPEPHKKKVFDRLPNIKELQERRKEAWMQRLEKEIRQREPDITPDQLEVRIHELLRLMAKNLKEMREDKK